MWGMTGVISRFCGSCGGARGQGGAPALLVGPGVAQGEVHPPALFGTGLGLAFEMMHPHPVIDRDATSGGGEAQASWHEAPVAPALGGPPGPGRTLSLRDGILVLKRDQDGPAK